MTNLLLSDTVLLQNGNIVACGAWKGGMSTGFFLNLGNNRKVFLFDRYEGLLDVPKKDSEKAKEYQIQTKSDPTFGNNKCKTEIEKYLEIQKIIGAEFGKI